MTVAKDGSQRTVLVTGAASGIGRAAATRLVSDGYQVVLADLDESFAAQACQALAAENDAVTIALGIDVRDSSSCAAAVDATLARLGRLDALVHCAGVAGDNAPLWEMPGSEWERVITTNLTGTFNICQAAIPAMLDSKAGRIVLLSSVAGKEGNPNAAAYSASKAGVIGLTKSLAKELALSSVLVNAVTPALIDTPIVHQSTPTHIEYMINKIPLGRLGKPCEVAALIAWLVSTECSFSTGAVFDISGGRSTY